MGCSCVKTNLWYIELGGTGGMQATEQGVVSFSFTSAPHALFMKKLLWVVVMGYSEDTGGFRASKGPCGRRGPLPPTREPGAGVIGVMDPPCKDPPPATVVSNVVGVGGMCGCDTGMAAWRSRSSVV